MNPIVEAWLKDEDIEVRCFSEKIWRDYTFHRQPDIEHTSYMCEWKIKVPKVINTKPAKNQPHVHAELIKAWADGAEIEFCWNGTWASVQSPHWYDSDTYRIKPTTKTLGQIAHEGYYAEDPTMRKWEHLRNTHKTRWERAAQAVKDSLKE